MQKIKKTGELTLEATTQKIRVVQKEGNREVKRDIDSVRHLWLVVDENKIDEVLGICKK